MSRDPISTTIALSCLVLSLVDGAADRACELLRRARAGRGSRGQSTAEYALVLLGAAAVAVAFLLWATKTKKIGKLFDRVIDTVTGNV